MTVFATVCVCVWINGWVSGWVGDRLIFMRRVLKMYLIPFIFKNITSIY